MLFRRGDYLPLAATGKRAENVIAYARAQDDEALIVIAPRLVLNALHEGLAQPQLARWSETEIPLPASLANRRYRDILSGEELFLTDRISMESVDCCSSVVLVTL
jgi:(1->4)-alpha-D-glucan 1-alpha-D-glucosylmutase